MEKWAKSLNAQKEAQKEGIRKVPGGIPMPGSAQSLKQESAAADAGFAMLQKAVSVYFLSVNLRKNKYHY